MKTMKFLVFTSLFLAESLVLAANEFSFYMLSTRPTQFDYVGEVLQCDGASNHGGYFTPKYQRDGCSDICFLDNYDNQQIVALPQDGLRFKGWWTKEGGWDDAATTFLDVDTCIETSTNLTLATVRTVKSYWSNVPVVIAKYVPIYDLSVEVAPLEAGHAQIIGHGAYYVAEEGESVNLSAQASSGYSFSHWQKGGTIFSQEKDDRFEAAEGCAGTYTAVFTGNVYTVTFDNNGSSVQVPSVPVTYASFLPTLTTLPTRNGYHFSGYNEFRDGSGQQYYDAEGAPLCAWDKTSSSTLYAQWAADCYRLTFEIGAGIDTIFYKIGDAQVWQSTKETITLQVDFGTIWRAYATPKPGFQYTETSDQNPVGGTISTDDAFRPYANPAPYRVTFHDPSGTFFDHTVSVQQGESATPPTWKRFGRTPSWSADVTSVTGNMTVEAIWPEYAVAFDGNGATSGEMPVQIFSCGETNSLVSNQFSRTAYTFIGWDDLMKDPPHRYADGDEVVDLALDGETNTLRAAWAPISYTITFDPNGAIAGEMPVQTLAYDQVAELYTNQFSRSDYTFIGWSTNKTDVVVYQDGQAVSNLTVIAGANITLYAVWDSAARLNALSIAADCNAARGDGRLPIVLTSDENNYCTVIEQEDVGGNGQCVKLLSLDDDKNASLTTSELVGKGTLRYSYWLHVDDDPTLGTLASHFELYANGRRIGESLSGMSSSWQEGAYRKESEGAETIKWTVNGSNPALLGDYVLVDNIRWIPDSNGQPEEGKDNAVVSTFALSDGNRLTLQFAGNEMFDYELWTNADLSVSTSWGLMATTNGEATVTFEPVILPNEPRLFYKVKTVQKR